MSEKINTKASHPRRTFILFSVVGLILGVAVVSCILFFRPTSTQVVVDSLSPRAREFIAQQNSDGDGLWSRVSVMTSPAPDIQSPQLGEIRTECFSITLPWKVINSQFELSDKRCTWRAKTISPLGHLVLSSYLTETFSDDSGIILRRSDTQQYQETKLSNTAFPEALLFRSEGSLIIFARKGQLMFTLALNELASSSSISTDELVNILQSVDLHPLPSPTPPSEATESSSEVIRNE